MATDQVITISRQDLPGLGKDTEAIITDIEYLSSYNWIEADVPTIVVPGSPPIWSPPAAPRTLTRDCGFVYIDQNAARHPESPLEPLFRALYAVQPTFNITSTDIVADASNITRLLGFVNPSHAASSKHDVRHTFTINLEVIGNTLIMQQRRNQTHRIIQPKQQHAGCYREFEKRYTTSQVDGSTGHWRISSYQFCHMNFIIRHSISGYVGTPTTQSLAPEPKSLSLSSDKSPEYTTPGPSKLRVMMDRQHVKHESTLRIKLHEAHRNVRFSKLAPLQWVSQTHKLVCARHRNARVNPPVIENVMLRIRSWEKNQQRDLKILGGLLNEIHRVVKELMGGRAVARYCPRKDVLKIRRMEEGNMLPDDLYSKWDIEDSKPANEDEGKEVPPEDLYSQWDHDEKEGNHATG